MRHDRIIAIDLETTGFSPHKGDRVIEVAAVVVVEGETEAEFQSLIRVPRMIPRQASLVHGITDGMLAGQSRPEEVFPMFRDFIGGSTLVAHNASFDLSFLAHEFGRLGFALPNRRVCTLQLAKKRFPGLPNHRLDTVARHLLGVIPQDCRLHRALDDARLTAGVWLAMESY